MPRCRACALIATVIALGGLVVAAASTLGGAIPGPMPIFPRDNWWNLDVSTLPIAPSSAGYIAFIGSTRTMHPDFGGDVSPGSAQVYGFPYAVVDSTMTPRAVEFQYSGESDGVNHATDQSFPFYPSPDEAIAQAHWIEGGDPGDVDLRSNSDRHLLIVDRDRRHLYELYNVFYDGSRWHAGSGAFFDLDANGRRPDGWTSADAAGLAILPGLVRYDEVFGPDEIAHAFRVTVRATNGYVYPASHRAGSTTGALPMGARLRLKASRDISGFSPAMQKIFRAMKKYGLIVADNGSDLYVSGTYDTRWDNDVLNPAFRSLTANDFEVIALGYQPAGPGIAAVHPGDLGIETHPDVVFVEKFEENTLADLYNRWTDILNGPAMAFDADVPPGSPGTRSLNIPWVGGGVNNGGHLYKQVSPAIVDTLHVRYYIKYPMNGRHHHEGIWMGGYNPPLAWPNPQAGIKPAGNDRFSAAAEQSHATSRFDHYDYWMNMRAAPDGRYWGNTLLNDPNVVGRRSQWMCVEHMVKLNNPVTASNGEHAIWIDGFKVSHLGQGFPNGSWIWGNFTQNPSGSPFEGLRWRNNANLQLNWIWLQNYSPDDPAGFTGSMKFDHVVAAKSYIGCLAPTASGPPAAPTGLRVVGQ
jgi:hypothetical protein